MSGQIGDSKINEVRERSDIVELVSQYVTLKRAGANHSGLCPFHSEKSPSFSVNAARQFFHCFGCGVGGDVFSFLMKIEGLSFPDAVRRLAERAGVDLEERPLSPEQQLRQQQRERLYRINTLASDYFHQQLMEAVAGEPARLYMRQRGYGRKAAQEYAIGYAPDSWDGLRDHLQQQGCDVEDVRQLGLIRPGKQGRGDYDLFRGRLIFPIYDLSGRVLAFAGRVLDNAKPKYINSPESPVYHKGNVLFGLYQARQALRQQGEVILVEGYFDQLALNRAGFGQAVATCGTALTSDHARLLKRYAQRVLLLFDQDKAGRQAAFKAMAALQEEGLPSLLVELSAGDDPDSFLQQQGVDAFAQRLAAARPAMSCYMEEQLRGMLSVESKVSAAEAVLERIKALASSLEQDLYLKELAQRSGIELTLLQQKLQQTERPRVRPATSLRSDMNDEHIPLPTDMPLAEPDPWETAPPPEEYSRSVAMPVRPAAVTPTVRRDNWSNSEQALLALLVNHAELIAPFARAGGMDLMAHPLARAAAQQLLADGSDPAGEPALALEAASRLKRLQESGSGAYSDHVQAQFDDCLRALAEQQKKRQREQLLAQMRQHEQAGESEQASQLLEEFYRLKKK